MDKRFERLLKSTEDLLCRVRIYDRNSERSDEITQMDEACGIMSRAYHSTQHCDERSLEHLAVRLQQIRVRVITMMEDLLHPA
ncbi:hypothetical protein [Paenibacillus montanisoli]|uniref:Uncharacterized protein n=1 Tax=Paenibacillus montanisoli TaxID=2081970 RepID=A0A328U8X7_9BACL|nr:hypothetical protein [Paenibacillus montanisoli]RAP76624.1 hypothetical protein DL346_14790 [Paenibacillus montanisoli]